MSRLSPICYVRSLAEYPFSRSRSFTAALGARTPLVTMARFPSFLPYSATLSSRSSRSVAPSRALMHQPLSRLRPSDRASPRRGVSDHVVNHFGRVASHSVRTLIELTGHLLRLVESGQGERQSLRIFLAAERIETRIRGA
jgi:hypothetical protein